MTLAIFGGHLDAPEPLQRIVVVAIRRGVELLDGPVLQPVCRDVAHRVTKLFGEQGPLDVVGEAVDLGVGGDVFRRGTGQAAHCRQEVGATFGCQLIGMVDRLLGRLEAPRHGGECPLGSPNDEERDVRLASRMRRRSSGSSAQPMQHVIRIGEEDVVCALVECQGHGTYADRGRCMARQSCAT